MLNRTFDFSSVPAQSANWPRWWEIVHESNLLHIRNVSWVCEIKPDPAEHLPGVEVIGSSATGENIVNYMFMLDNVLIMMWYGRKELNLLMASNDITSFKPVEEKLKVIYPELVRQRGDEVRIEFWYCAPNGQGSEVNRLLAVPTWGDIKENYGAEVREEMERLTGEDFTPNHGGQLLIWQGPPGTGKTFAIRSIMREWSKWCDSAYVVDPEVFFNNANYMMSVVLEEGESEYYEPDDDDEEDKPATRWKLIVLEDCGELLSNDAKLRTGQALSRLLNVADGLIGQGLNVLIFITTNEELDSLHEAVRRPGRCASKIVFAKLSVEESNKWLESKGSEERVDKETSLAELYGKLEGFKKQAEPEKERLGFHVKPKSEKRRLGFFTEAPDELLSEEHGESLGRPVEQRGDLDGIV